METDMADMVENPVDKHFIKGKGTYLFRITADNQFTSPNSPTLQNKDGTVKLYLSGTIYNFNGQELIKGFISSGCEFIHLVEGSFILFMVLEDRFYIFSDKVNSKKAFYLQDGTEWYFSNDIDRLPTEKSPLDMTGLACYLANGAVLNDITIFEHVHGTRRASIHLLQNGILTIRRYWDLVFHYDRSSYDEGQAQNELIALLIDSVRRCYEASEKPLISLSAGNDSRTIIGILHRLIQAQNVTCFSYSLVNPPKPGSDASLAASLARFCGYPHRVVLSYQGDLLKTLIENAREGKCIANFCDEILAWHTLAENSQTTDLFCGDQCIRTFDIPSSLKEDVLGSLSIRGEASIRWLKAFLPKKVYHSLSQGLQELVEEIYASTEEIIEPEDKKYYLAIDQRLNHMLLPWREFFTSQAGFVHNPLLDTRLFEFLSRLPPEQRLKKNLFSRTIPIFFADHFSLGIATHGGYSFDLNHEIRSHKAELIAFVLNTDSRLDEIIPKSVIVAILHAFTRWAEFRYHLSRRGDFLRKKIKFINTILNPIIGVRGRLEPPGSLLIRLLLIRTYLSNGV